MSFTSRVNGSLYQGDSNNTFIFKKPLGLRGLNRKTGGVSLCSLKYFTNVLFLNDANNYLWYTQTFFFCVLSVGVNMVGTASSRSVTLLPVLSMYCSSKWLMHRTEKRVGVQSFHFMFSTHFLSFRGLYRGNLHAHTENIFFPCVKSNSLKIV